MSSAASTGHGESFVSRVSAAIRPIDELAADRSPIGQVQITLEGITAKPLRNRSGWQVFMDLPSGNYVGRLVSEHYLDAEISITVQSGADPVALDVPLLPRSSYPFPSHATLLRGVVKDQAGVPVNDAVVEGVRLEPADSYAAMLAAAGAMGGTRLFLSGLQGEAPAPDTVWLLKNTNVERLEYVRFATPLPADSAAEGYPLAAPLQYAHPAGTTVYPVKQAGTIVSRADSRGDVAIPIVRMPLSRTLVSLSVKREGYRTYVRDIQCDEGRTGSLGIITLLSI
ncbi:conserved hypothetical protein [Paenibacillus curdlanolyticus YK9]|uniref:Carboxypeptidase regulatory-like domain-containing protein n=1 Tax=Paenibacillus curdlanolyticus YK9 TaxID=717606 RepID=E0I828_9BACL|nr:hypothetical protein [Paenibacillus curdlanolyticus]EFM11333.1 conserved hypothetical protein [Paenibacillus curdlanolyticus YK9]